MDSSNEGRGLETVTRSETDKKTHRAVWRWALLVLILIAETEFLLDTHYAERTAVRALVRLPLYHILLAFLAFSILIRLLSLGRLPGLPDYPLSGGWLVVHVSGAVFLNFAMTPLWRFTKGSPGCNWVWFIVIGAYFGSWLASLVPPARWWHTLRLHIAWILAALLLGCVALGAAEVTEQFWVPLASGTFYLSRAILGLVFDQVIARPDELVIGTPGFHARIEAGCSGLEGLGLVACYIATYLWLRRTELRFPQAFLLFPAGLLAIWLCNSLRVAFLVIIGTCISPAVAVRGFHSQAGWIAFTIISLTSLVCVERYGWFRGGRGQFTGYYPAAPLLLPIGTLLFSWMVCQAFSTDFDILYPIRVILVGLVLWKCYPGFSELLVQQPTWRAVGIGLAVYFLWLGLVSKEEAIDPLTRLPDILAAVWLPLRVIGAVLVIPLTEELAFRGYLLRRLQCAEFETIPVGRTTLVSILVSSLAFGVLHQQWLAGTVAGLAYGWATRSRAGLTDAVVAHGITNLCLSIQVLVLGDWWLW